MNDADDDDVKDNEAKDPDWTEIIENAEAGDKTSSDVGVSSTDREYKCENCSRPFTSLHTLCVHLRSHAGKRTKQKNPLYLCSVTTKYQ